MSIFNFIINTEAVWDYKLDFDGVQETITPMVLTGNQN
jgi:hypothetical protein